MEYTKILCYDIKYAGNGQVIGPAEVEIMAILPTNWKFDYISARNAVKAVLESQTCLKVVRFEWRPLA